MSLNGNVFDFSVSHGSIESYNILNVNENLMAENNRK